MPERKFLIKVLSGLHTGAERYLSAGETRLGSSPICDLVVHDKGIAAELLVFTRTAEGVGVRALDPNTRLLLDGREQDGPFSVTDFGIISTSALYLAVGAEDGPWDIPPPAQLFAGPGAGIEPVTETVNEIQAEGSSLPEDTDGGEDAVGDQEDAQKPTVRDEPQDGVESEPEETGEEPESAPARPVRTVRANRRKKAAAGLLAVALASLPALYSFRGDSDPAHGQAPSTARVSMQQVRDIAERYRLDATFELSQDNVLTIEGYALSAEDEHGFVRAMFERGVIVKPRLVITEQFRNNIQNILDQYMDPVRNEQVTTSIAEGDIRTLALRGYVQDAEKWREILSETVDEVASINYVDEVTHWDDGYGYLRDLIDKYDLGNKLYLEQDLGNDRVLLFSSNPDDADERLGMLMDDYRQTYAYPEILLDGDVADNVSAPEFVENKLVGASFNPPPYLLFDDGQRYFVGSVTADSYRVEEINERFAVFLRDGQRYNYNFDDLREQPGPE